MHKAIQYLFRSCAVCSGHPVSWDKIVCATCLARTINYFSTAGTTRLDFAKVRFGFAWSAAAEGEAKAKLIHALKGNVTGSTWRILAEEFLIRHFNDVAAGPWLLIPAPPAVDGAVDHARLWADALAAAVGGHRISLLRREGELIEQKRLGRAGRAAVRMELIDHRHSRRWLRRRIQKGWKLAFVDDVVTTGATARAAWQALGQPRPYQIWALSYRTTLRNSEHFGYNALSKPEDH